MSPEPPLDATGIARRHFSTVRKGFDPDEVRAFLHELTDLIGRMQRAEAHERERAERAEARAALAEKLDQHRLVELLGEETARVLEAAREAGGDIRTKAEEAAARMVREAQSEARAIVESADRDATARRLEILAEADDLRREAETEVELRRSEGRDVVDAMRREAEAEREAMLADGERARAEAEATGEQIRAAAREQGRRLVGEAQTVRERMLADLARRRRTAREQLERLNAARERLLAAYEVVKRTVDEATSELTVALPEAKVASEAAMRRVSDEPEETVEVIEAELSVARMAGLVDDVAATAVSDDELDEMLRELAEQEEAAAALAEADTDARAGDGAGGPDAGPDLQVVRLVAGDDEAGAAEAGPEPVTGAGHVLAAVPEPEPEPEGETGPYVDELFARIRAENPPAAGPAGGGEGKVAVVTDAPSPPVGTAAPRAEPESAPEAEDEPEGEDLDPETVVLRDRDTVLAGVERELGRRLKRVLADEQNEVLDLLRRGRSVTFAEVVPAEDEHADRFAIAATSDLDTAAAHGAARVGGVLGESCDELASSLGRTLVEPLRHRIERSFDDCDGDLEEVTERLRALYREWKGQHIGAAVRHFTAAAYAWGAYEAAPDGAKLRWLVDRTGEACPDADDNALAGPVAKGTAFPTGDRCAPAHPGCRCLVVPADLIADR
ncbi:MAG TPA: DivIVA domain-containing protein [Acidimicrobiales bacterium]|nr:DivIVA domain-containing protein [Acidimicrobiales bacterium]